jgi:hypothetical protein
LKQQFKQIPRKPNGDKAPLFRQKDSLDKEMAAKEQDRRMTKQTLKRGKNVVSAAITAAKEIPHRQNNAQAAKELKQRKADADMALRQVVLPTLSSMQQLKDGLLSPRCF